ncbi:hypothetical protein [Streptomyces sp. NPDC048527]|uniref:hypothetical protein n=1 Tax=Streptomyces sp. NPDC048527 TaxID=3365568 RepID=UPI00372036E1
MTGRTPRLPPDSQTLAIGLHPTLVLWRRVRELSNNLSVYGARTREAHGFTVRFTP